SSSQNRTRTPLADVPRGANSSSRRPGIRLVSSRVARSARPKSGTRFCEGDQARADSAIIMVRYAGKGAGTYAFFPASTQARGTVTPIRPPTATKFIGLKPGPRPLSKRGVFGAGGGVGPQVPVAAETHAAD